MVKRLSQDARRQVLTSAAEEARRRGDRRIGTDHILLGLLDDSNSVAAQALGVSLGSARATSAALDRAALAEVGIEIGEVEFGSPPGTVRVRKLQPFTSGARAVLERSVIEARAEKARGIGSRHLLLGILSRNRPDPAAELLAALGVDPAEARQRLEGSAN
jgi:ATP-dependent Clp protease ATP-binding subunit ClpA